MKRAVVVLSMATTWCLLAPAVSLADQKQKSADDGSITIMLDVGVDASQTRASRPDWSLAGTVRGDTIVATGMVFNGGSVPDGDTTATFLITDDSRVGSLVSRGQFIADGTEIASGVAQHSIASTHIFMLDDGSGVITEGLEGSGPEVRAVVGGYGRYSGATGQVTQEVLGFNGTGGTNLRFTFTLKVTSPQAPAELMRKKTLGLRR
jgi:hypothetical protein